MKSIPHSYYTMQHIVIYYFYFFYAFKNTCCLHTKSLRELYAIQQAYISASLFHSSNIRSM